ncbi:MAG: glutaredoxin 3 [Neisseria sp.]|nr:glutaredoxin 3 [Neisseria sp.]
MKTVTLYSSPYCPYCMMAKTLLNKLGVNEIVEIGSHENPDAFQKMRQETGTRTVPQIFIGDVHVGGFSDLRDLHEKGGLLPLLHGE